jgi:aryl-alcohol dehydrogenase-like predicted oxidoreductase
LTQIAPVQQTAGDFDATTPVDEVPSTLDGMVRAGKIRCIGCSNFSGWHPMKSRAESLDCGGFSAQEGRTLSGTLRVLDGSLR